MKNFLLLAIVFVALSAYVTSDYLEDVEVTYHVWVNDNVSTKYKIKIEVPSGSKLYDVMVEAANKKDKFKFESIYYQSLGHFITKIGDNAQVPAENKYWLIFITNNAPDKNNPPGQSDLSPLGVSSLVVEDGKHYLFWLRTANFTHN